MEQSFTFERNGVVTKLPFNPELEGFKYAECKCAYVKFKRTTGDVETQLNFYYKSQNKYIQVLVVRKTEGVSRQLKNEIVNNYPSNQVELQAITNGL